MHHRLRQSQHTCSNVSSPKMHQCLHVTAYEDSQKNQWDLIKKISADINNATLMLIGICSGMRRYNAYVVVSSRFCRLSVSDAAGPVLSLAKSYKCSSSCPPTKSELSSPLPMWVEALDVAVWLSWPFSSLLFDPCDKKLNLSDSRSCKNATQ